MELPIVVAVAVAAVVIGGVLGFLVATRVCPPQVIKASHAESQRIVAEARERQKDLILEAKDEKLRLQREAEDEARARRSELGNLERRLLQRDEQLEHAGRKPGKMARDAAALGERTGRRPSREPAAQAEVSRTVRVRAELLDYCLDTVGELILAAARLREVGRSLPEPHRQAHEEGVDRLQGIVKDLHGKVMSVRMTPIATLVERLPRVARDLARKMGKQVEVVVTGAEIEIDRAILDELSDPLVHVIRNAVDHGLEPPHLRQLAGKPAAGRITVAARRERDRVILEVSDDGPGFFHGRGGDEAADRFPDRKARHRGHRPGGHERE